MKVLIVDDNVDFSSTLADIVKSLGLKADTINIPDEAISYMLKEHSNINLILLDVDFGFSERLNGLDLLDIFRRNYPLIPIVMITGRGTIEMAVKATKLGAINFIEKNIISKARIKTIIDTILADRKMSEEDSEVIQFLEQSGIVGKSKAINDLVQNIIRYAKTDLNVLITGNVGTGKKLVATCLHKLSNRSNNELVTVEMPALTNNYREELFGSNINANDIKIGLFQKADKGTLFLDDLDDLPFDLQMKLLAPIRDRQVKKVGGENIENLDIRFISATTKDLSFMIKTGSFSEQLYHRLRECEINIPALKTRKEDIPHIVFYYTKQYNQENVRNKFFTPSSIDYLTEQQWNGNVRELNAFVRLCLQTISNDAIEVTELIKLMQIHKPQNKFEDIFTLSSSIEKTLKEDLAGVDKIKIEKILFNANGNVSKAAAMLGISRGMLHIKIKRYNINVKEYKNKK